MPPSQSSTPPWKVMGEILVYGERHEIPQILIDEMMRLRALERERSEEDNARLLALWEAKHGPLPKPEMEPRWIPVEHGR